MCQYLTTNYIATCLHVVNRYHLMSRMAECQVTYIYFNQLKFIRGWHFKYHGFIALQSCSAFHNAGSGVAIVSGSCNPVCFATVDVWAGALARPLLLSQAAGVKRFCGLGSYCLKMQR